MAKYDNKMTNYLPHKRIGIFGGTFNPIHIGHLILAKEIQEKFCLDKVIFVPAYLPPHKKSRHLACANDRFIMVKLAVRDNRHFNLSDFELHSKKRSYSVFTIAEFKRHFGPNVKLVFIAGADSLKNLSKWRQIDKILKMVDFIVASRPGFKLRKTFKNVSIAKITGIDISSRHIRNMIKMGRSIKYLVPELVLNYIIKNRLYK